MTEREVCPVCDDDSFELGHCPACDQDCCDSCWQTSTCCLEADAVPRVLENTDHVHTRPMGSRP